MAQVIWSLRGTTKSTTTRRKAVPSCATSLYLRCLPIPHSHKHPQLWAYDTEHLRRLPRLVAVAATCTIEQSTTHGKQEHDVRHIAF
eukprot:35509-Eustigmatos_ZCMA.PRE.1